MCLKKTGGGSPGGYGGRGAAAAASGLRAAGQEAVGSGVWAHSEQIKQRLPLHAQQVFQGMDLDWDNFLIN
jgi:hypothetical protein